MSTSFTLFFEKPKPKPTISSHGAQESAAWGRDRWAGMSTPCRRLRSLSLQLASSSCLRLFFPSPPSRCHRQCPVPSGARGGVCQHAQPAPDILSRPCHWGRDPSCHVFSLQPEEAPLLPLLSLLCTPSSALTPEPPALSPGLGPTHVPSGNPAVLCHVRTGWHSPWSPPKASEGSQRGTG